MAWTAREGVAGIALLAMYSDAIIVGEEDDELRDRLRAHPLFHGVGDHDLGEMLARIERVSRKEGADALFAQAVGAIPPHERPTAFLIAAEIVAADRDVAPEESAFLKDLRAALSLSDAQVRMVLAQLQG